MGLTALDYEGIRQVQARFAQALDFGDPSEAASCFAVDGTLTVDDVTYEGAAAIEAYATEAAAKQGGHVRNSIVASPLIHGDGDVAKGLSYLCCTRDYGPARGKGAYTRSKLLRSAMLDDSYVRQGGRWLIASRAISKDGYPDVLARFGRPLEIAHVDASQPGERDGSGMSAIDYEAIRQLTTRYGYTLDFADKVGFADCFTADGAFELLTLGDPDFGGQARIAGTSALLEMAEALGPRVLGHVRHGAVNALIEGDGTRARASSYGFFTTDHGQPPRWTEPDSFMIETTGIYRDTLVKEAGTWRFETRTFRYDGWPDVLDRVGRPLELGLFNF